jgi:hypothetical protein
MPVYQGGEKLSRGRSEIPRPSTQAVIKTKFESEGSKVWKMIDFLEKGDNKFIGN